MESEVPSVIRDLRGGYNAVTAVYRYGQLSNHGDDRYTLVIRWSWKMGGSVPHGTSSSSSGASYCVVVVIWRYAAVFVVKVYRVHTGLEYTESEIDIKGSSLQWQKRKLLGLIWYYHWYTGNVCRAVNINFCVGHLYQRLKNRKMEPLNKLQFQFASFLIRYCIYYWSWWMLHTNWVPFLNMWPEITELDTDERGTLSPRFGKCCIVGEYVSQTQHYRQERFGSSSCKCSILTAHKRCTDQPRFAEQKMVLKQTDHRLCPVDVKVIREVIHNNQICWWCIIEE